MTYCQTASRVDKRNEARRKGNGHAGGYHLSLSGRQMRIVTGEEVPACITRVAATRQREIRIEPLNKNAGRHRFAPGASEPEINTPVMARERTARPPRGLGQ